MENTYLSQFKHQLEKIKKEIERRLRGLEKAPEFGDDTSIDTEAHESEEFGTRLSIAQTLRKRLHNINSALLKFGKKKYGFCENCGKKISEDLLKLVPESRFCKECKKGIH